jgi:hypothetical protein
VEGKEKLLAPKLERVGHKKVKVYVLDVNFVLTISIKTQ